MSAAICPGLIFFGVSSRLVVLFRSANQSKIGDRLQIAQQNTNPLAALTAAIWCLSSIFKNRSMKK
jgi:hypothetical protein